MPIITRQAISPPKVVTAAVQIDAMPKPRSIRVMLHLGVIILDMILPTGPMRKNGTV